MRTNTRLIFKTLLRQCHADCVLDIGSCDGSDSLKFRELLPEATLTAFEANPFLYKKMTANPAFRNGRIEVVHCAISDRQGLASFHVTDVDYENLQSVNPGTSSLLVHEGLKVKETVQVQTRRVDEFILAQHPEMRRIGLWIDAEGAEFAVIEGISGIKDRVVAVHVETARVPMRVGQKVYAELEPLMRSLGFVPLGTNMSKTSIWGDVAFVNEKVKASLGLRLYVCLGMAWLSFWCRTGELLLFLKTNCAPVYRLLWRIYKKFVH